MLCTLSVYVCRPQLPPTAFLYQLTQPHPIIKLYCSVFYCLEFQWYFSPPPERNDHHTTTFVPITQQTHHQHTPSGPATRLWLIPTQSPKQFGWRASVSQSCCVYSGQDGHGWASLSRSVKTLSHHILFFNAVWHGCLEVNHTHAHLVSYQQRKKKVLFPVFLHFVITPLNLISTGTYAQTSPPTHISCTLLRGKKQDFDCRPNFDKEHRRALSF